jgi:7-cyano-7-deazaguanine reductase
MNSELYREGEDYSQVSLSKIRTSLAKNAPLETFVYQKESPGEQKISIFSPELTCICPFSDFPDFGTVHIKYIPNEKCLELKSFKLYINAFRNLKIFHEGVIEVIFADFLETVQPKWAKIKVEMNPRGNVTTVCKKEYGEN